MKLTVSVFDLLCVGGVLAIGAGLYFLHPASVAVFAGACALATGMAGPGPWKKWRGGE